MYKDQAKQRKKAAMEKLASGKRGTSKKSDASTLKSPDDSLITDEALASNRGS